jgi:uridine kinase
MSYIVGISGASGSGKTSVLRELLRNFSNNEVCLVSQDNYYKNRNLQKADENGILNFDLPDSLDLDAYIRDIVRLHNGEIVTREEYTFNNKNKESHILTFLPAPVIIVEGLFLFHEPQLKNLFDLKVFIDVEDHIRLKRRIIRDNNERGYPLDDVLYRYEYHVFPSYQKYIMPYKYEVDMIIPNNHRFEQGVAVLVAFLKEKIK